MLFCIVHYNTPELTTALCYSINKFHKDAKILIFDNSDKKPFKNETFNNVKIIDNTKQQLVNFDKKIQNFIKNNNISKQTIEHEKQGSNFGSYKHTLSIDYLLNNLNENFILLDSDVLIKRNVYDIIDNNVIFSSSIRQPNIRIFPFIVYFNLNKIKEKNLNFNNDIDVYPNYASPKNDTCGHFLQEVLKYKLPYKEINYENYVVHYGNGSWKSNSTNIVQNSAFSKSNKNCFQWLIENKSLWQ